MSGSWERSPVDVLIAYPISGWELISWEFHENQVEMLVNLDKNLKVIRQKFPEPNIDISRDKALAMAIQVGARWLWFVDTDIIMPPDTLQRLIAHDKPIVSALYVRRHNPPFNEMLKFRPDGQPGLRPIMDGEYQPNSLVECDAVATGCLLVRTDVVDKIQPFKMTIDGQPARDAYFLWTEWRLPTGASEDFSFCVKARKSGDVKVYCDTSIRLRHFGPLRLAPSGNNSLQVEFPSDQIRW